MKVKIVSDTSKKNKLDILAITEEVGEIGYMRVSFEEAKYVVESLFVGSPFRRQNVANALLDFFLNRLPDENTRPVEIYYTAEENGDSLHSFMQQREDFVVISAGLSYDMPVRAVYENELVRSYLSSVKDGKRESHTHPLSQVSDRYLSDILLRLESHSLPTYEDTEAMRADIDMELSMVYCARSGAEGCLLVRMLREDEAELSALYTAMVGFQAIELIAFAAETIYERNPKVKITLLAINDISARMAKKLGSDEAVRKEAFIGNWLMTQYFEREEG